MRSMQKQLGNLGTISALAYRHRETKKNLCRVSPIFVKADCKTYGPLEEAKLRTVHYIPTVNSERHLGMAGC
jgi:hypothetical protein